MFKSNKDNYDKTRFIKFIIIIIISNFFLFLYLSEPDATPIAKLPDVQKDYIRVELPINKSKLLMSLESSKVVDLYDDQKRIIIKKIIVHPPLKSSNKNISKYKIDIKISKLPKLIKSKSEYFLIFPITHNKISYKKKDTYEIIF